MMTSSGILGKCSVLLSVHKIPKCKCILYLHKITLYKRPICSNTRNQHIFYPLIVVTGNRILGKKN